MENNVPLATSPSRYADIRYDVGANYMDFVRLQIHETMRQMIGPGVPMCVEA